MGCGIRTGAGAVMISLHPKAGASIAVFGVGPVGMSAILAAIVCGCTTIIAVDINSDRLEMAKKFGATHSIHSGKVDPVTAIQEITGEGADFTLECVGQSQGVTAGRGFPPARRAPLWSLRTAWSRSARHRGRAGYGQDHERPDGEGDHRRRFGPGSVYPHTDELYRQGRFPFDRLITFYPFDEIGKAVGDMEKGKVIKPVLRP